MTAEIVSFDRVAHCYDATRAMPPEAALAVTAGLVATLGGAVAAPRVLEVGIGTGRIAVPLAEAGVRVVGLDVAPAMLARLRARRPDLPVVLAESTRLPFGAGTFDAALFVHVLHLVPDATATLRAARAVVRSGGLLVRGTADYGGTARQGVYTMMSEELQALGEPAPSAGGPHEAARGAFAALAAEVGAPVEESAVARWTERRSRREQLDGVATRLYSVTWTISDAVMPELVRRLERRLAKLPGGLDGDLEYEVSFVLATIRLPF